MTTLLSHRARLAVLLAAIAALLFDGFELGRMPVASLSVSRSLLGADYTPTLGGDWFARFTAALMLSQIARIWHITPDSWRWIFYLAAAPAVIGVLVIVWLPESPRWLASRDAARQPAAPMRELFRPPLLRLTIVGILLGSIPMVGAWAASKWTIPWADKVGGVTCGLIYALGLIAICWAPDTTGRQLKD